MWIRKVREETSKASGSLILSSGGWVCGWPVRDNSNIMLCCDWLVVCTQCELVIIEAWELRLAFSSDNRQIISYRHKSAMHESTPVEALRL